MKRRTLAEIRTRARAELATNPTITAYDMHDGEEFNRHLANPWLPMRASLDELGQVFIRVTVSMDGFRKSLEAALGEVSR